MVLWGRRRVKSAMEASAGAMLKAVGLTHVRYNRGDPFGVFMAWMSLLPVFLAFGCFPTHMLYRRNLRTIFFMLGMLLNDGINQVIKRSIRQPRPWTCEALETCHSFGMPSAHTQFMCFFATFVTLLAVRKLKFTDNFWFFLTGFISWPLAFFVGMSRVYLGYHSLHQVYAGGCLGTVLGALWFYTVTEILAPFFPRWSESSVGRYLCVKDDSHIPNVARFEYDNSLEARRKLQAAAASAKKTS